MKPGRPVHSQLKTSLRVLNHACVLSTMVCQLSSELEKYDPAAVKRIEKEAQEHRERHQKEAE
jgi:hypothetical protein